MEADHLRHLACHTVAEVTLHRVAHRLTELVEGFTLCGNAVPQGGCDVASIHFIRVDLKNDFAHNVQEWSLLAESSSFCLILARIQMGSCLDSGQIRWSDIGLATSFSLVSCGLGALDLGSESFNRKGRKGREG
jgi:hypothetical protein